MNCNYKQCQRKIMKIIGLCKKCNNYFCDLHRHIERHECMYLQEIINNEKIKLKNELLKNALITEKIKKI